MSETLLNKEEKQLNKREFQVLTEVIVEKPDNITELTNSLYYDWTYSQVRYTVEKMVDNDIIVLVEEENKRGLVPIEREHGEELANQEAEKRNLIY